uniref:synaptonemal complex protein 3-like n=1 Tax=Jaculus jaculus TaxID=51337 RepID=UPI001E1AFA87|nr:synaptonemal complex protein 3-like [Jaculus jaculus]
MAAEDRNHHNMVPHGRKHPVKSVKPPMEDPAVTICALDEEDGNLNVLTKGNPENSSDLDKLCKKVPDSVEGEDTISEEHQKQQPSTGIFEDIRKKYKEENTQKFKDICQQWDSHMHQISEADENLIKDIQKDKIILRELKTLQKKRLMKMKQMFSQHKKCLEDVEKKEENAVRTLLCEFMKEASLMAERRIIGDIKK